MQDAADAYRRFLAGEEDALAALVTAWRPGLQTYLTGLVRDAALAEDLTQEAFVRLCLRRPPERGEARVKTWLYTVGRNLALDALRRRKRRGDLPLESAADRGDDAASPELQLLRQERAQAVHRAMAQLPVQQRELLRLTYFEGFDTAALAKILKKSRHNVSAQLYRAKQSLKAILEKEGDLNEI